MPFRADLHVARYWKDMFDKASVDPPEAFSTTEELAAALTAANGLNQGIFESNLIHLSL